MAKIFITNYNSLSINKLLQEFTEKIFIKIDIEGSEYRILEQIIENENKIEGLVIEFHDIDLHLERIITFINKSSLTLVHFHPNNFGGVDQNGNPIVIELTFSKSPKIIHKGIHDLPNKLDMPNNPNEKDIIIN